MSDAFSSDGAEEQGVQDYDSLEEYIFETERDHDDEIRKALRLRSWQELQLRYIKNKIGTNAVEVMLRSYSMGLRRLREEHGEDSERLGELLNKFIEVINEDPRNRRAIDKINNEIMDYNVELDEPGEADLGEPRSYKFRQSEVSEVEDNYIQDSFFGSWIHRYVATLGFLDSELLQEDVEKRLSSFMASLDMSLEETEEEMEQMIVDFLGNSITHWATEGLDRELHDKWLEVTDMLSESRMEKCNELLAVAERYIEE